MSDPLILAHDLGTGGNKASLYNSNGVLLSTHFEPYKTYYPHHGWHEQKPMEWWRAVTDSTRTLMKMSGVDSRQVSCCAISGHSLGVVPISGKGELLQTAVPIWSDSRAQKEADTFFENVDENDWYMLTGNGFPAPLYSIFKLMWLKNNLPDIFSQISKFIGTKDFINYKMTGELLTDNSYASGFGTYDLNEGTYSDELISASRLPKEIFPEIVSSTTCIGRLHKAAADEMGLEPGVQVMAGGVDNSCMALGAMAYKDGRAYLSLGSSAWIAVSSSKPILDSSCKPYVFAHVVPNQFASATAIFSAGSSLQWVRNNICCDLIQMAKEQKVDPYDLMTSEAANSPIGANNLIFNPSLAGGSSLDYSPDQRGAFVGLNLGHERKDLIRGAMEGISLGLKVAFGKMQSLTTISSPMMIVGGGSKSLFWRQMLADVFNIDLLKTSVDQEAASLGAASIAAVGSGLWTDFNQLDHAHRIEGTTSPIPDNSKTYETLLPVFDEVAKSQANLAHNWLKS